MFYLISENLLVNINTLRVMESVVKKGSSDIELKLFFSNAESDMEIIPFKKDTCFNINHCMEKIALLEPVEYKNKQLVLTDFLNINALKNEQFYLHKFSNILVHLDSVLCVSLIEGATHLITYERNIKITETPKEVFEKIQLKIKQ